MAMVMRHRHASLTLELSNLIFTPFCSTKTKILNSKLLSIVIHGRLILDIKRNICAACCLWKISDGLQMADNGNEAADDADSEIQFVSTKTERLKLSWPITDWSERTSAVKTRRFIYNMKTRRFSCYRALSCLCPGITSWRRTR